MEEIDYIRNRFYVFYDYVIKTQGSGFFIEHVKEVVEKAYEKKDAKKLKRLNKEFDTWLIEMFRPDEKEELNRLLKEKLGEDIGQSDLKRIDKINKIVKRGRINNLNEYSLLQQRVEEIYADESKREEVEMLNKLLADFHK